MDNEDKLEHWILEKAVSMAWPVSSLASEDEIAHYNFRSGGKLNHQELMDKLYHLFKHRALMAMHTAQPDPDKPPTTHYLTVAVLEVAWARGITGKDYVLTQQGGELWVGYAKPDWDLYLNFWDEVSNQSSDAPKEARIIVSPNRQRIEDYLSVLSAHGIETGEVTWVEEKPFHATYWKVLPVGCEARFELNERNKAVLEVDSELMQQGYFSSWYTTWYTV